MEFFLVNRQAQPNGDHEVHRLACRYLPLEINRHNLGYFPTCHEAVWAARSLGYPQVNGCYWCCNACHTQ